MTQSAQQDGTFSIQHAFVVQFESHAGTEPESFKGRIEHIVSGKSARFQSLPTLQSFVMQVLTMGRIVQGDRSGLPHSSTAPPHMPTSSSS